MKRKAPPDAVAVPQIWRSPRRRSALTSSPIQAVIDHVVDVHNMRLRLETARHGEVGENTLSKLVSKGGMLLLFGNDQVCSPNWPQTTKPQKKL